MIECPSSVLAVLEPTECQSQYFSQKSLVLLVMIVYRRVAKPGGTTADGETHEIQTEQYFFISEQPKKGTEFVSHCILKLLNKWKSEGRTPKHIHFWSDGCAGDFKSRHAFLDRALLVLLARADGDIIGVTICFFETGHGKGPWDAAGGWFKHILQMLGIRNFHLFPRCADAIADHINSEHG